MCTESDMLKCETREGYSLQWWTLTSSGTWIAANDTNNLSKKLAIDRVSRLKKQKERKSLPFAEEDFGPAQKAVRRITQQIRKQSFQ